MEGIEIGIINDKPLINATAIITATIVVINICNTKALSKCLVLIPIAFKIPISGIFVSS